MAIVLRVQSIGVPVEWCTAPKYASTHSCAVQQSPTLTAGRGKGGPGWQRRHSSYSRAGHHPAQPRIARQARCAPAKASIPPRENRPTATRASRLIGARPGSGGNPNGTGRAASANDARSVTGWREAQHIRRRALDRSSDQRVGARFLAGPVHAMSREHAVGGLATLYYWWRPGGRNDTGERRVK